MFLCETWHINDFENVVLPNFNFLSSNATKEKPRGRASGGMLLFFNKNVYTSAEILDISSSWIIVMMHSKKTKFILACVYFKPDFELTYLLESLATVLQEAFVKFPDTPIYVGGDMNARLGNLGAVPPEIVEFSNLYDVRESLDVFINSRGTKTNEFMTDVSFVLLNGRTAQDYPPISHLSTLMVDL